MESNSVWENLLLSLLVLVMLYWMMPGIKANMANSRMVKADWLSVIIPIGAVVLFVIFLIMMV
jgi:hypothetical protein